MIFCFRDMNHPQQVSQHQSSWSPLPLVKQLGWSSSSFGTWLFWLNYCSARGLLWATWLVVSHAIWDDDSELTIFSRWLNHFKILQCTTTMRNKMLEAFYTTNQSLVEIFIMLHRPTSSKEQSTSRSITPRGPGRGGTDPAGYPSKKDKKGNTWEEW